MSGDREVCGESDVSGRRPARSGNAFTRAPRVGNRDKELRYRKRAEAMIGQFGPEAQREIENGRREQMRSKKRG